MPQKNGSDGTVVDGCRLTPCDDSERPDADMEQWNEKLKSGGGYRKIAERWMEWFLDGGPVYDGKRAL